MARNSIFGFIRQALRRTLPRAEAPPAPSAPKGFRGTSMPHIEMTLPRGFGVPPPVPQPPEGFGFSVPPPVPQPPGFGFSVSSPVPPSVEGFGFSVPPPSLPQGVQVFPVPQSVPAYPVPPQSVPAYPVPPQSVPAYPSAPEGFRGFPPPGGASVDQQFLWMRMQTRRGGGGRRVPLVIPESCLRIVTTIAPNTGTASAFFPVTITGDLFGAGDTVQVVSLTLGALAVDMIVVVDVNTITARILVDETSVIGAYDVRVGPLASPQCIGALPNGFTVT